MRKVNFYPTLTGIVFAALLSAFLLVNFAIPILGVEQRIGALNQRLDAIEQAIEARQQSEGFAADYVYITLASVEDQATIDGKVFAIHARGLDAVIYVCPDSEITQQASFFGENALCYPILFPKER